MADLTYSGDGDGGYEHKGQQWVPEGTELQYYLDYGRAIQEQESYILQNQQRGNEVLPTHTRTHIHTHTLSLSLSLF